MAARSFALCIRLLVPSLTGRSLARLAQSANAIQLALKEFTMLWHVLIRRDITSVWQITHSRPPLGDTYDDTNREDDCHFYKRHYLAYRLLDRQYYKDLLVVESDPRLARTAQKLALAWRLYNTFAIESAVCRQQVMRRARSLTAIQTIIERLRTLTVMCHKQESTGRYDTTHKKTQQMAKIERKQRQVCQRIAQMHRDLSRDEKWELMAVWEPESFDGKQDVESLDVWTRRQLSMEKLLLSWQEQHKELYEKLKRTLEPAVTSAHQRHDQADQEFEWALQKLYRRAARKYHPDKRATKRISPAAERHAQKIWHRIEVASDVLLTQETRRQYNNCKSHEEYLAELRAAKLRLERATAARERRQGTFNLLTAGVPYRARKPMVKVEGKTKKAGSRVRVRWFPPVGDGITGYALRITTLNCNAGEEVEINIRLPQSEGHLYLSPNLLPSGGVISVQLALKNIFGQGEWSEGTLFNIPGYESKEDRRARIQKEQIEEQKEAQKASRRLHNMYARRLRQQYSQVERAVEDVNELLDASARAHGGDESDSQSDLSEGDEYGDANGDINGDADDYSDDEPADPEPLATEAEIQENLYRALSQLKRRFTRAQATLKTYTAKYGPSSTLGYWVIESDKPVWKRFVLSDEVISRHQNLDVEAKQILEVFADVLVPTASKDNPSPPAPKSQNTHPLDESESTVAASISTTTTNEKQIGTQSLTKTTAKPKSATNDGAENENENASEAGDEGGDEGGAEVGQKGLATADTTSKPGAKGKGKSKSKSRSKAENKTKDEAEAASGTTTSAPPYPASAPPRSPFKIFLSHGHDKSEWKDLDHVAKAEFKRLAKEEQSAHREWRQEKVVLRYFGGTRSEWLALSVDEREEWKRRALDSTDGDGSTQSSTQSSNPDIPVSRNNRKDNKKKQRRRQNKKSSGRKERRRR